MIDIDTLSQWCERTEVAVDEIRQGEGYLEITDGHTKVELCVQLKFWFNLRMDFTFTF